MTVGKLRVDSGNHSHSLGIGGLLSPWRRDCPVTLALSDQVGPSPWRQDCPVTSPWVARAIAFIDPSLSISPAPGRSQPYTHSWQRIGTKTETYVGPAASPGSSSSEELLQPEFLQAKTPGSSSRQRRRHLDVEGGRKREEPSWRGRRGRGAGSQEPSWWQPLRVCLLVGQTLLCFNCYILQKKLSQDLRSPISSRPNKRDYSPVLGVYWSAD